MQAIKIDDHEVILKSLLAEIKKNKAIYLICQDGKPVADLIPHYYFPEGWRRTVTPHPLMSRITIAYDPVEPLGNDEWPEEE